MEKGAKILCVDDAQIIREKLKILLEENSFQVTCASSGMEGIKIANTENFQLVITDLNMPNMSGIEMIESLKKVDAYKKVPFLVLTTDSTPELKKKGKEVGVLAWIIKPFNDETFMAVIKEILSR